MPYIFKYKERVVNFTDNEINIIGGSLYSINKRESEIKVHHNDYKTMKKYFTIGGRFMIINYTFRTISSDIEINLYTTDIEIFIKAIEAALEEMGEDIHTDFDTIIGSTIEEARELINRLKKLLEESGL